MKRYTAETLPKTARYIGSTEGPDRISEEVADRLDYAIEPVYILEPDGSKSFFELYTRG